ncbi:CGNR zinc finger domain-containing protein [Myceligenerans halotolerans]
MQFNHDNMTGAELAADLVNLVGSGDWTIDAAEAVLRAHDIRWHRLTLASSDLLRDWSSRLRSAFEAVGTAERCAVINALLDDGVANVYLTTHDSLRPHLHFAPDSEDVCGRVRAVTAGGLAIFTVEAEGARLGTCARETCRTVFVDTSRNGRRAYCSARCGNADAVERHRARKNPGGDDRRGRLKVSGTPRTSPVGLSAHGATMTTHEYGNR